MTKDVMDKLIGTIDEVEKVILGKRKTIQLTIAALLAGGHVLIEDVPGVGKTLLAKTLAGVIQAGFSRIQGTPDLLPSDILGVSIFNDHSHEFEFRKGPIFTDILLVDEVNRTTPKTQAALLEAMAENAVTIDGTTYPLSSHFFVVATQNPIEYEGTYPLPEAQLDRFFFKLRMGYPKSEDELKLMQDRLLQEKKLTKRLDASDLQLLKQRVNQVYLAEEVASYALALVQATRDHPEVALGVSPRGSVVFAQAAKAYALTQGRTFVTPDDFQNLIGPVFSHRLTMKRQMKVDSVLQQIVAEVSVPVRR